MARVECELLRKTREIAKRRGLDLVKLESCPYGDSCDGTFCPLIQEEPESLLRETPITAKERLLGRIENFLNQG